MKQFLAVMLGLLSFMTDDASGCNVTAANRCMLLLNGNSETGVAQEGIAAMPTAEQLQKMCSNISAFETCYDSEAALCENDVMFSMTFGTIEKTIGYLCREGYNDILQHSTCWSQTEVTQDSTMCHVQQTQMLMSLQDLAGSLNSTDLKTVWCQILDNTTSCMTKAVSKSCEAGARCIMEKMMKRSLSGLANFMQCPATESTNCSTAATTLSPTPGGSSSSSSSSTSSNNNNNNNNINNKATPESTEAPPTARPEPADKGDLRDRSTGTPAADSRAALTLLPFVTLLFSLSVM